MAYLVGHNRLFERGPAVQEHEKWCGRCKVVKAKSDFFAARNQVDGLQGHCKQCTREKTAKYRERNRAKTNRLTADCRRMKRLGVAAADYNRMLEAQNELCAICHQPERAKNRDGSPRVLAVDHNHATGAVRGLLCNDCNRGLGFFGDDSERLRAAVAYLAVHGVTNAAGQPAHA